MLRPSTVLGRRARRPNSSKGDETPERPRKSNDVERVVELRRVNDEQRKEIAALRQQVEAEKQKVRDAQREKTLAQRQAREQLEKEREHLIEVTARRAANDKEVELKGSFEAQLRSRDQELRQVVKFREDELRKQRQELIRQRDEAVRTVREDSERRVREQLAEQHSQERAKLIAELWAIREQKTQVEQLLEIRTVSEQEKDQLIRTMRHEHAQEVDSLLRKSKIEAHRDAQQLRLADRIVQLKDQELAQREYSTKILEMERDTLAGEVNLLKSAESWDKRSSLSKPLRPPTDAGGNSHQGTSPTSKKRVDTKDRDALAAKITRMTATIHSLEEQLAVAKGENVSMRTQLEQKQSVSDARVNENKIRQLRQRVAELSRQSKQQQEKIKTMDEDLKAAQGVREGSQSELLLQKRQFQRQRAKDLSDFREQLATKDTQLQTANEELQKLKMDLANTMNSSKTMTSAASSAQGVAVIEERDRLQTNMNLVSKEKMLLERKFALQMKFALEETAAAIGRRDNELEAFRQKERQYLQQLEGTSKDSVQRQQLEVQLESQVERCSSLVKCVEQLTQEKEDALSQLHLTEKVAQELQEKTTNMQVRLSQLQEVEEERTSLSHQLQVMQSELEAARVECSSLQERVSAFEGVETDSEIVCKQLVDLQEKLAEAQEKLLDSQCVKEATEIVNGSKLQFQLARDLHSHTPTGNDEVLELQDQVHGLEEECAEKELQCMALQEQVDKLKAALEQMSDKFDRLASPEARLMNGHCEEESNDDRKDKTKEVVQPHSLIKLDLPSPERKPAGRDYSLLNDEQPQETNLEDEIQAAGYQHGLNDGSDQSETETSFSSDSEDSEDESGESGKESSAGDEEEGLNCPQKNGTPSSDSQEDLLTASSSGDLPILGVDDDMATHSPAAASVLKELRKATQQLDESMKAHEKRKLAGGNIAVVMALYDYDPRQFSPNNPEEELEFKTGDYIYVYGRPDEDGFYHGELLNGTQGLVPSNFVEPVVGEGDAIFRQVSPSLRKISIESKEDDPATLAKAAKVPAPQRLLLQRQFDRSVIVQWTPVSLPPEEVLEYKVLANEELKATVTGNYTSAMVDGLNLKKHSYWVSVRTVTVNGESPDPDELLFVGRQPEVTVKPVQNVKVTSGTTNGSLVVSWEPSSVDDNVKWHQVMVNGQACSATLPRTAHSCEIPSTTLQQWPENAALVVTVQSESVTNLKVVSQQSVFTQAAVLHHQSTGLSSRRADSESDELEFFPSPDHAENDHAERDSRPASKQALVTGQKPTDQAEEVCLMAALYSYNPQLQSPNDDGCDTELAFNEGDILQIFGKKDESGFLQGELNGRRGLVPSNLVHDIDCDDEMKLKILKGIQSPVEALANVECEEQNRLLNAVADLSSSSSTLSSSDDENRKHVAPVDKHHEGMRTAKHIASVENHHGEFDDEVEPSRRHARALFSYNPEECSPNVDAEAELAFVAGTILSVFGEPDEDGFYQGELNGQRGLVPSNYVELVPSNDIVVLDGGTLGIYQEGMTREVAIDVDFDQSAKQPARTRRPSEESSTSTASTKKKGIISRSHRFVKKTFGRHAKKTSPSVA